MPPHLTTLPLETLEFILQLLPDFMSLWAVTLSCKAMYRAFQSHPTSVTRDVALNLTGGSRKVVLEAIRAIRIEVAIHDPCWVGCAEKMLRLLFDDTYDDAKMLQKNLTLYEARELAKRVHIGSQLEVVFSARRKDRLTQNTSRLSAAESIRFHLALYRLDALFSLSRKHRGSQVWRERTQRHALFYTRFSDEEFFRMFEIFVFVNAIMVEAIGLERYPISEKYSIYLGFQGILRIFNNYETLNYKSSRIKNIVNYIDDFEERFLRVLAESPEIAGREFPILLQSVAPDAVCSVCRNVNGIALWNIQNWYNLPRQFRLDQLPCLLGLPFSQNPHERFQMLRYLGIPNVPSDKSNNCAGNESLQHAEPRRAPSISFLHVLAALFTLDMNDKWDHLTAEDLLCADCLRSFMESRLWMWWGATKDTSGLLDCWYGIKCSMQTTGKGHQEKFNHVCPDTHMIYSKLVAAAGRCLAVGSEAVQAIFELDDDERRMVLWRAAFIPEDEFDNMTIYEQVTRCGRLLVSTLQDVEGRFKAAQIR